MHFQVHIHTKSLYKSNKELSECALYISHFVIFFIVFYNLHQSMNSVRPLTGNSCAYALTLKFLSSVNSVTE